MIFLYPVFSREDVLGSTEKRLSGLKRISSSVNFIGILIIEYV